MGSSDGAARKSRRKTSLTGRVLVLAAPSPARKGSVSAGYACTVSCRANQESACRGTKRRVVTKRRGLCKGKATCAAGFNLKRAKRHVDCRPAEVARSCSKKSGTKG